MALNKYMHPRNVYKDKKPNFKELAAKYEEFNKHVTCDEHGKVHIDFKKPECLRALSWALLKDDFGLDVLMPLDRLIPTIPLRLNYILWLEDILGEKAEHVTGLDIGTGASCVYPLLGAKKNGWKFTATESDGTNYQYAKKNVETNRMTDQIQVIHVSEGSTLPDILSDNNDCYDFCMCNPPFYGSNFEAWGMLTSRSASRPEPSSVSTASPVESIVPGGEVEFVKRMISDSTLLKERIRVYTTMLGKKSSIPVLKEELRKQGVTNASTTEFCQGKTMRWGLGWSYDSTVIFPKPPSKTMKAEKPRPPLVYYIPKQNKLNLYTLDDVTEKMLTIFLELQISVRDIKKSKKNSCFTITAVVNTWSHQRRKRRQQKRLSDTSKSSDSGADEKLFAQNPASGAHPHQQNSSGNDSFSDPECYGKKYRAADGEQKARDVADHQDKPDDNDMWVNKIKTEQGEVSTSGDTTQGAQGTSLTGEQLELSSTESISEERNNNGNNNSAFSDQERNNSKSCDDSMLFCAVVTISQKPNDDIVLEMQWQAGESRESMHQVLQYIKNKLG